MVELFLNTGTGGCSGASSGGATSDAAGASDAAPADGSSVVILSRRLSAGTVDASGAAVWGADLTSSASGIASWDDDSTTLSAGGQVAPTQYTDGGLVITSRRNASAHDYILLEGQPADVRESHGRSVSSTSERRDLDTALTEEDWGHGEDEGVDRGAGGLIGQESVDDGGAALDHDASNTSTCQLLQNVVPRLGKDVRTSASLDSGPPLRRQYRLGLSVYDDPGAFASTSSCRDKHAALFVDSPFGSTIENDGAGLQGKGLGGRNVAQA